MSLARAIAVVGLLSAPFAVACQSDPQASTGPAIEQSGFGGTGDRMWLTATVRDVPVGQFATVSFKLYAADGTLLATESHTEQGVNPGARITVGTQASAPMGQAVARVEPTLVVATNEQAAPVEFSDVVLDVGPVTFGEDYFGKPTAEAELTNPSDREIPGARVGITCFDGKGEIIGGAAEYPGAMPAHGSVKVSARLLVSGQPERCEMTAQPSEF
jgi:hypothetical protein